MCKETRPRGWKKGFKIVTLCDDGKLRSMIAHADHRGEGYPIYSDERITRRKPELEPFWVHTEQRYLCYRLRTWPYAYELWACVYRPARDRENWPDIIGIGDAADAVRLTIKLAERPEYGVKVEYQPECTFQLG